MKIYFAVSVVLLSTSMPDAAIRGVQANKYNKGQMRSFSSSSSSPQNGSNSKKNLPEQQLLQPARLLRGAAPSGAASVPHHNDN
jgi:hypothetical protein